MWRTARPIAAMLAAAWLGTTPAFAGEVDLMRGAWKVTWTGSGRIQIAKDTASFNSSPASLRVEAQSNGEGAAGQTLESMPKGPFTVSAFGKKQSTLTQAQLAVMFFDAQWKQLEYLPVGEFGDSWKQYSRQVTPSAEARFVIITMNVKGVGQAWLDDAKVVDGSPSAAQPVSAVSAAAAPAAAPAVRKALGGWKLYNPAGGVTLLSVASGAGASAQGGALDLLSGNVFDLPKGKFYINGRIRKEGNIGDVRLVFQSMDGGYGTVDYFTKNLSVGNSWSSFSWDVTANTAQATNAVLHVTAQGNGSIFVDGVEFSSAAGKIVEAEPDAPAAVAVAAVVPVPAKPIGTQASAFAGRTDYTFDEVAIGGGGAITYVACHPKVKDLRYCVADVAGLHKWDPAAERWRPLFDFAGPDQVAAYHAELAALDANNPNVVLVSTGKEWVSGDPAIYRSEDQGKTWSKFVPRNAAGKPCYISNGTAGHRLVIDPNDSRIAYYGTRKDGLQRSEDNGRTWKHVGNFPFESAPAQGMAVTFVQFDPTSAGEGQPTKIIYAGVAAADDKAKDIPAGVYRSGDAGKTWTKLENLPAVGNAPFGKVDAGGNLYLHRMGLHRLKKGATAWETLTPAAWNSKYHLFAFDLSPSDPNLMATGEMAGERSVAIHLSSDGGKSWRTYNNQDLGVRGKQTAKLAPQQPWDKDGEWMFACMHNLTFDPFVAGRAYYTGWYAVAQCDDIRETVPTFRQIYHGIEMVCLYDLLSPPKGAPLFSGMMDLGGFRHEKLDAMPASYMKGKWHSYHDHLLEGGDLDFCEANPDALVMAGGWRYNDSGTAGYSTDNGKSWQQFESKPQPDARYGRIAVSATDPKVIVWIPRGANTPPAYYTKDGGRTWGVSAGSPRDVVGIDYPYIFSFYMPLASDRARPDTFYIYDRKAGSFLRSDDGGANFRATCKLPAQQGIHHEDNRVEAAPGMPGEVWVAINDKGLFRSSDAGETFTRLDGVERAWRFGFGAAMPGKDRPAVYLLGRVKGDALATGRVALYRSDDMGASWLRLSPDELGFGQATVVCGDRQTPGRVYVGDNGRAIRYGTPVSRQ